MNSKRIVLTALLISMISPLSGCYASKQMWDKLFPNRRTVFIEEPHKFPCDQTITTPKDFDVCKQRAMIREQQQMGGPLDGSK